jgi:hypothetical protein
MANKQKFIFAKEEGIGPNPKGKKIFIPSSKSIGHGEGKAGHHQRNKIKLTKARGGSIPWKLATQKEEWNAAEYLGTNFALHFVPPLFPNPTLSSMPIQWSFFVLHGNKI